MFSGKPRCIYNRNALSDVICQLRFPPVPSLPAQLPANLVESLRKSYPNYIIRNETRPADPRIPEVSPRSVNTHQFSAGDKAWRLNFSGHFFALSCSNYTNWETFAHRLDQDLVRYFGDYMPDHFDRIGLRYINIFSRRDLGLTGYRFRDLFAPCYLGPLSEADVSDEAVVCCNVDTEMDIGDGCRLKLHAGPGMLRGNPNDRELKFIFDADLSKTAPIPPSEVAEVLETLHGKSFPIFRGAITDTLHDLLMVPPKD